MLRIASADVPIRETAAVAVLALLAWTVETLDDDNSGTPTVVITLVVVVVVAVVVVIVFVVVIVVVVGRWVVAMPWAVEKRLDANAIDVGTALEDVDRAPSVLLVVEVVSLVVCSSTANTEVEAANILV